MRRFCRGLIKGLTVLSLLLCVATAALWIQSYQIARELQYDHRYAIAVRGSLHLYNNPNHPGLWRPDPKETGGYVDEGPALWWGRVPMDRVDSRPNPGIAWKRYGVEYWEGSDHSGIYRVWIIPLWFVVLSTALPPCIYFMVGRLLSVTRRRRREGRGFAVVQPTDIRP